MGIVQKTVSVTALGLGVITLCSCSSSAGKVDAAAQPSITAQSSSTHTVAAASSSSRPPSKPMPKVPKGATASSIAAMLNCAPKPEATDDVNIDLGPKATSHVVCMRGGKPYEIYTWATAKAQQQLKSLLQGLVPDFGELYYVQGNLWDASLYQESAGNQKLTAAQVAEQLVAAKFLQGKLGGEIVHLSE